MHARNTHRGVAILLVVAAASTATRADVVWPALYLESRLVSLWAIPAGLVAEFVFLRWWLGFSTRRAVLADIAMNAVSTAVGIVMIPIAGLGWEFTVGGVVNSAFHWGTFNLATWVVTCGFAVLINTWVEGFALRYGFKTILQRGHWLGLGLANVVSVALAMASLHVRPLQL